MFVKIYSERKEHKECGFMPFQIILVRSKKVYSFQIRTQTNFIFNDTNHYATLQSHARKHTHIMTYAHWNTEAKPLIHIRTLCEKYSAILNNSRTNRIMGACCACGNRHYCRVTQSVWKCHCAVYYVIVTFTIIEWIDSSRFLQDKT